MLDRQALICNVLLLLFGLPLWGQQEIRIGFKPLLCETVFSSFSEELARQEWGQTTLEQAINRRMPCLSVSRAMDRRYIGIAKIQEIQYWDCTLNPRARGAFLARVRLRFLVYDVEQQVEVIRQSVTGYAAAPKEKSSGETAGPLLKEAYKESVEYAAEEIARVFLPRSQVSEIVERGCIVTQLGSRHGVKIDDLLEVRDQQDRIVRRFKVHRVYEDSCKALPGIALLPTPVSRGMMVIPSPQMPSFDSEDDREAQKIRKIVQSTMVAKNLIRLETLGEDIEVVEFFKRYGTFLGSPRPGKMLTLQGTLGRTRFSVGEPIALRFTASCVGYIYILNLLSDGRCQMVYPLVGYIDNAVAANVEYRYPIDHPDFPFLPGDFIAQSRGQELFFVILCRHRLMALEDALDRAILIAEEKQKLGKDPELLVSLYPQTIQTLRDELLRQDWGCIPLLMCAR